MLVFLLSRTSLWMIFEESIRMNSINCLYNKVCIGYFGAGKTTLLISMLTSSKFYQLKSNVMFWENDRHMNRPHKYLINMKIYHIYSYNIFLDKLTPPMQSYSVKMIRIVDGIISGPVKTTFYSYRYLWQQFKYIES